MTTTYDCWNCGAPLEGMILPVSRRQECERCGSEIHVCRQCVHFDARVAGQCREERAEDVSDKTRANFCDYYAPSDAAYEGADEDAEARARAELAALFGDAPPDQTSESDEDGGSDKDAGNPLDDLFDPDKLD